MAIYKISRCLEASIIEHLKNEITSDWNEVSIVKTFQQVTTQNLPCICVRVGNTTFAKAQIGDNSLIRTAQAYLDVFGTSDGLRLDLVDWLVDAVKEGMIYYDVVTTKANRTTTATKTANGRISVTRIDVSEIDFNTPKSDTDPRDRYRSLITLQITIGRTE